MENKDRLEGWVCPECSTVHAPWVLHCNCQSKESTEKKENKRNGFNPIKPFRERA